MTTSLKEWVRNKLGSGKEKSENGDGHDAPALPIHGSWSSIPASTANMAANYGAFQNLPLEIRQQILGHAFGNRTIHVDLAFDHPLTRKSRSRRNRMRTAFTPHAEETGRPHSHCGFGSDLVRNTRQPKQWQWLSCVCHRGIDRGELSAQYLGHTRIDPCEDRCLPGRLLFEGPKTYLPPEVLRRCEASESGHLLVHDCFIGVTGWLLACRHACVESLAVFASLILADFSCEIATWTE